MLIEPLKKPLGRASIGIVIVLAFVCRWLLSGDDSYWLDELVSVHSYGIKNKTAAEAIESLAKDSIHPPLYQLILYYWMRFFGHTEVVTRFLSNLYVSGAVLCAYVMVREAAGRRRALMTATFLSFMYLPFFYAMETRSYAQTLLLTTLSSLALFRFMRVLAASTSARGPLRSGACALLVASNTGLLLTHYFNVFFLTAQGVFLLGWVALRARAQGERSPARVTASLLGAPTPLIAPLALLLIVWGPVMARSYRSRSGQYKVHDAVTDPFTAFVERSVGPNFLANDFVWPLNLVLVVACGALLALFYAEQAAAFARRPSRRVEKRALGFYAFTIAFVPFLVSCALFAYSGHERYSNRYFIFTAPPLAIMLVLAIERGVLLADRSLRRLRAARGYLGYSALYTLVVGALLVLPGTYAAVDYEKADWRGIASMLANITDADRGHDYIVFETGFGRSRLGYYLKRAGAKIKVRASVTPADEKRFAKSVLKRLQREIEKKDFLVLTFTHLEAKKFEKTLAALDATYEVHIRILDDGRGLVIYRVGAKKDG